MIGQCIASMGPRSDNRGYGPDLRELVAGTMLQWVHGLITVVMLPKTVPCMRPFMLQWVHGLITVVMAKKKPAKRPASKLQWVHGLITVVMGLVHAAPHPAGYGFNGSTV